MIDLSGEADFTLLSELVAAMRDVCDVDFLLVGATARDVVRRSVDAVREDLVGKLGKANRFTKAVNNQYAVLLANFYKVQAAREGITAEDMYALYPVGIQRTSLSDAGGTKLGQTSMEDAGVKNPARLPAQMIAQGGGKVQADDIVLLARARH